MEIYQKLKESESIVIEGKKKSGKLTFMLYLLSKKYTKISIVSPLSANKTTKKLEAISRSFEDLEGLNKFLDIFAFREDWITIKNEFGFKFLLQDLEFFIANQKNEVIVFHRIGTLFEYSDRDLIDDFFNDLLAYGIKYKKQLIFTLDIDDVNYDLMSYYLVESIDLYMKIEKIEESREVSILYALSPVLDQTYLFENHLKKLKLNTKDKSGYINKDISVIVISKNKKIQRFHKYLLEKEGIELSIVDSISDSLEAILKNPDYLIFSQEEEESNFSVCELSSKYNLYTKTLYLLDKPFLRVDDRLKAIEKGCVDVLNFQIPKMHYILELAKYLNKTFYKNNIIKDNSELKTKEEVIEYINYLIEERVLFTILKIDGKVKDFSYLRDYDKYVELEKYGIIILVNLIKGEVANIVFKKMAEHFMILETQDCLDLFFGEKLCIN